MSACRQLLLETLLGNLSAIPYSSFTGKFHYDANRILQVLVSSDQVAILTSESEMGDYVAAGGRRGL